MKISILFLVSLFFISCGLSNWETENTGQESLYVLSIDPAAESSVSTLSQVEIIFSKPLAVETVTSQTLFIIFSEDYQTYEQNWDDLHDEVEDGDVVTIPYTLTWLEGNQKINLQLLQTLETGREYVVVALPKIQAFDYRPLDQTLVGSLTQQFSSSFLIAGAGTPTTVAGETVITTETAETTETSAINSTEANVSEANYPETAVVEESQDFSSQEIETGFDWEKVLITEAVPDPQQDHSESSAGNGVLFDEIPGSGTVSSTDEYIEIFNGTETALDVSAWSLNMLDGTDVNQALNDSAWDTYFSAGGSLENLNSGEFLVLGDPEGTINNAVTLELLDGVGEIVDSVEIEDANADTVDNESYYRGPDGEWFQGLASPGYFLE